MRREIRFNRYQENLGLVLYVGHGGYPALWRSLTLSERRVARTPWEDTEKPQRFSDRSKDITPLSGVRLPTNSPKDEHTPEYVHHAVGRQQRKMWK